MTASDAQQLMTALCQPTRCPKARITARHGSVWERSAEAARVLPRERRLSDFQRAALKAELHRLSMVIEAIGPAPPGTTSG